MRQYGNYIKDNRISAVTIFKDGCFTSPNYFTYKDDVNDKACNLRFINFLHMMAKYPSVPVVIGQSWQSNLQLTSKLNNQKTDDAEAKIVLSELDNIIKVGGSARSYYIVGVPPHEKNNSFECKARSSLPIERMFNIACAKVEQYKPYHVNNILKIWAQQHKNAYYIDPANALCKDNYCMILDNDGQPIYSDSKHLSKYGANIVGKYIFDNVARNEEHME